MIKEVYMGFLVTKEFHEALEKKAQEEETSMSSLIRKYVKRGLQQ
jgi:hypothetical protein